VAGTSQNGFSTDADGVLECSDGKHRQCESRDGDIEWPSRSEGRTIHSRVTLIADYFLFSYFFPTFGLITGVWALARSTPQQLAYSAARYVRLRDLYLIQARLR